MTGKSIEERARMMRRPVLAVDLGGTQIRAALVTPDRGLARRVSAHLKRWGIVADDSASPITTMCRRAARFEPPSSTSSASRKTPRYDGTNCATVPDGQTISIDTMMIARPLR